MAKQKISVVDFFSGCGGTSCGLRDAGMDIVLGLDHDADCGKTFQRNLKGARFITGDILELQPQYLFEDMSVPNGPLLFAGCAPCQPFTKQRTTKRGTKDERRHLLLAFGKMVEHWLPDFVLVENVPGLKSDASKSAPFSRFLALLRKHGYHFNYNTVAARDYGVPQKRQRLVLMASRHGPIQLPDATHGPVRSIEYSTVRQWISALPILSAGEQCEKDANHRTAALSEVNLKRIRHTPEGGGRESWPPSLLLKCHAKHQGHSDVYGRLWWDKPASALTTRCLSYSNGRFGHPEQDRAISAREAACLQTFPRNWVFEGSLQSISRQIGNAVPPLMAKAIGRVFIEHATALIQRKSA